MKAIAALVFAVVVCFSVLTARADTINWDLQNAYAAGNIHGNTATITDRQIPRQQSVLRYHGFASLTSIELPGLPMLLGAEEMHFAIPSSYGALDGKLGITYKTEQTDKSDKGEHPSWTSNEAEYGSGGASSWFSGTGQNASWSGQFSGSSGSGFGGAFTSAFFTQHPSSLSGQPSGSDTPGNTTTTNTSTGPLGPNNPLSTISGAGTSAVTAVPEAGSFLLLASGLLALGGVAWGYKYFCTYDYIPAGLERKTTAADIVGEEVFRTVIDVERRRGVRSRKPAMLMVFDVEETAKKDAGTCEKLMRQIAPQVVTVTRETDLLGWYEGGQRLGIVLIDLSAGDNASARRLGNRVAAALQERLGCETAAKIMISLQMLGGNVSAPEYVRDCKGVPYELVPGTQIRVCEQV